MIRLLLILLILGTLALPLAIFPLVVSDQPRLSAAGELDYRDLEQARALLARNDPRRRAPGSTGLLTLSRQEINLLLRYGLSQVGSGAAAVDIGSDSLKLSVSAELPANPLGAWFNLSAVLYQSGGGLWLDQLQLGTLQVPESIANWLLRRGVGRLRRDALYRALLDSVQEVRLEPDHLAISYRWQPELVEQARVRGSRVLLPPPERERLLAYTERIGKLTSNPALPKRGSLDEFMAPLFILAVQRSRGGDPVAENRALLAALALYVNGVNTARLLDVPADGRYQPRPRELTLRGRGDLAQHFIISAALAAAGGSPLADAVGLSKEVRDASRGSGFSFTDLAADRAGVRFAEVATGPEARNLQQILALGAGESDYMPMVDRLPEFMRAARFEQEYGQVDSPAYRQVAGDIEQRISALPVHRL